MNFRRLLSLTGLLALALAPSLHAVDAVGDLVFTIEVPAGLSPAGVHDAVKAAAVGREYTIKEDKPDQLVFTYTHRKYEANFTAVFDPSTVKLYSDSYKIDGSGARMEKAVPELWVKYLHGDLVADLDQAAVPGLVGDQVWIADVPGGLSAPGVHNIVKAAVIARGYSIKEDKPDHLIFYLTRPGQDFTRRGYEAHLAVVFDAKSVRLYSDSYVLDDAGARVKKEVPDHWVNNLREDFAAGFDQAVGPPK
jgi:stage V sporulation protein SpoVS